MCKLNNLKGKRFGRLVVLERDIIKKGNFAYWICKCDCGKIKSVRSQHLTSNKIVSCGCYAKEVSAKAKIKRNNIEICDNYAKIHIFNSDKYSLIDIEDIPKIKDYCWNINHSGYLSAHINMRDRVLIHRIIMQVQGTSKIVDHINHNTLDNRKENLRVFENNTYNLHNLNPKTKNPTGIRNIYLRHNKFQVIYKRFGKKYYVGTYNDIKVAKEKLIESIKENNFIYGGL